MDTSTTPQPHDALEDESDDNYEPLEEEIIGYAQFLGMDLKEDQDLLFIAEEGLRAPVPEPWKAIQDKNNDISY